MPDPVTTAPPISILGEAAIGFCGKLPARGDFVKSGLPRRFVEPWHDWMQRVLAASRRALGAPLKFGGDPLIGSGCGLGAVPRAAVGIELCIGRLRQRLMRLSPLFR